MFQSIKLQNIRTFEKAEFEFDQGVNLIIGKNGSGKTTLVESLALFAFGRYQSVERDAFVIGRGADVGRVEAVLETGESLIGASVALEGGNRINKINESKSPSSDIIGLQRAILFNPETIELVSGPPQIRRKELDLAISQKDHSFVRSLLEYRRVLKHRNRLLKLILDKKASEGDLDFWDQRLAEEGVRIVSGRTGFLDFAKEELERKFSALSGRSSGLCLRYLPTCDYERFEEVLVGRRSQDIALGLTGVGPHRDDMEFVSGAFKFKEGASRGEQRLGAFALKLVERDYLQEEKGDPPVLLMDDIFSELDNDRRGLVADSLDGGQIIMTATDRLVIPAEIVRGGRVIGL